MIWWKYWRRWATGKPSQLVLWMVGRLKGGTGIKPWQDNDAEGRRVHVILLLQRQHLIRMTPAGFALSVRRRPHPGARIASQSLHNKAASAGNCRLPPRFIVIWADTIHIWNILSAAPASRTALVVLGPVCHYGGGWKEKIRSSQVWPKVPQLDFSGFKIGFNLKFCVFSWVLKGNGGRWTQSKNMFLTRLQSSLIDGWPHTNRFIQFAGNQLPTGGPGLSMLWRKEKSPSDLGCDTEGDFEGNIAD